jgi:hypothetical protein
VCAEADGDSYRAKLQPGKLAFDAITLLADNLHAMSGWARRQFVGQEESLASFFQENGFKDSLEYLE